MNRFLSVFLRYLPLILGVGILLVAAPLLPWRQVWPYIMRVDALAVVLLVVASMFYYLGRILRYWLALSMLGKPVKFGPVALACLEAQPVSVLPGGELYRGVMLKRYTGISLEHGAPIVFAQSVAESVGLLIIALIGTALIHHYFWIVLGVAVLFGVLLSYIYWHNARANHRLVNRVPWVEIRFGRLKSFMEKNRRLMTGWNFVNLILASYVTTFAGIAIIYIGAAALKLDLNWFEAVVGYTVPMMLQTISFMPGGFGVSEGGSIGVFALFDLKLPEAVALTIVMRVFTLGIGFVYGFGAFAWSRIFNYRLHS